MAMRTVKAAFDASTESVDVTWDEVSEEFGIGLGVTVDSGGPPGSVTVVDPTTTGCTVKASAPFVGSVDLFIYDK